MALELQQVVSGSKNFCYTFASMTLTTYQF